MKLTLPMLLLALCAALTIGTPAEARQDTQRASASKVGKVNNARRPASAAKARGPQRTVAVRAAQTRRVSMQAMEPAKPSFGQALGLHGSTDPLDLKSSVALVVDQDTNEVLFSKNPGAVLPIASITKLMTAMVVLDARLGLNDLLTIVQDDVDTLRGSSSHVPVGTELSREDMLRLALMSSENRASAALARNFPGGVPAFVAAMNRKAVSLGLRDTRFSDSTGLNSANVSSARDLVKMVSAASRYPLIREFSTTANYPVSLNGRVRQFNNTNALVSSPDWQIGVSKTGFINESGKCLVMQAWLLNKPMIIVLLDSFGRFTRVADAQRVKRWLESAAVQQKLALHSRGPAT